MKPVHLAVALALTTVGGASAAAAQTATQTVTIEVQAINLISVSGNPGALVLSNSTATAGGAPSTSSATTTWSVTTNEANRKITAQLNSAMPTGVRLKLEMGAPSGASAGSAVTLGTTGSDVVTGITRLNQTGLTITYTLEADASAGTVASTSRTVTFTITAG